MPDDIRWILTDAGFRCRIVSDLRDIGFTLFASDAGLNPAAMDEGYFFLYRTISDLRDIGLLPFQSGLHVPKVSQRL